MAFVRKEMVKLPSIREMMWDADAADLARVRSPRELPAYHGESLRPLTRSVETLDQTNIYSAMGAGRKTTLLSMDFALLNERSSSADDSQAKSTVLARSTSPSTTAEDRDNRKESPKACRTRWTPEEDELLLKLVSKHGARKWEQLAVHFPNRKGPQLRSRWCHSLADMESKRPFTPAEDEWIMEGYRRFGAKWKYIASFMEHRLPNDVLNRAKALQRLLKSKHASVNVQTTLD